MNLKGLTPQSLKVFEAIKKSDLLQEYILIGGTALSIQINNRLSEDLDFRNLQQAVYGLRYAIKPYKVDCG